MEPFDPQNDKIAISLLRFKMLKKPGLFGRYFEPYIVSFAADSDAASQASPALEFATIPFSRLRVGQEKKFAGHGRFIYQPKNPGEFVAYSMLFMESEEETREIASTVKNLFAQNDTKSLLQGIIAAAVPQLSVALKLVQQATVLTASVLEKTRDKELFVSEGGFLRDAPGAPYDISTSTVDQNDFIECETSVIPLRQNDSFESTSLERSGYPNPANCTERISLL